MSSVQKNASLNIIRVGFNLLFPLVSFPLVSKALGPQYLGKVDFVSSLISYFTLISSVGIPTYGVIICAKEKNDINRLKKTICELLYINLFFVVVSYLLLIGSLCIVPQFGEYRILIFINSFSIMFSALGIEWLYNALEQFKYITIRSIVFKIISLILIILFINEEKDYFLYSFISVFALVGSNICNFIHAKHYLHFYSIREINIKRHLIPIATFFASSVAGTINANTDTIMLGFLKGDYAVGLYTFSAKIKALLTVVMTAGLTVFVPRFSAFVSEKQFERFRNELRKIVLITMSVAIGITFFFIGFIDEVIRILGGTKYMMAKPTLLILTSCIIVLGMTWTLGVGVLQVIGREKKYAKTIFYACIVNITLNGLLIPFWGEFGAAVATFVTEVLNMILFYYYSKDFLQNCLKRIRIEMILFLGVVSMYVSIKLKVYYNQFPSLIVMLLGGIIFAITYVGGVLALHKEIRDIVKTEIEKKGWKQVK